MSQIGSNLDPVEPWSSEYPFLDRMKSSSLDWIVRGSDYHQFTVDTSQEVNGYFTSMPAGAMEVGVAVSVDPPSLGMPDTYVVTWSGNGSWWMNGATVVSMGDHTATIQVTGIEAQDTPFNQIVFWLNGIDANNPIHDIHIVRSDQVDLYNSGEIFNPDFIEKVQDMDNVRFMDWGNTNSAALTDWSDRTTLNDRTWSSSSLSGVPVEVMVKLCNEAHVDMWYDVPTAASDDYVAKALTYIHSHLDPSLTAHIEYSNEVWNWSFVQAGWAANQAAQLWGHDANGDGTIDYNDPNENVTNGNDVYYGYRSAQIASMAHQIWGSDAPRLNMVLSTQTDYPGLENYVFEGVTKANLGYPDQLFKDYAITGYFGNSLVYNLASTGATVLGWARAGAAGLDAAFDQLEHGGSVVTDSVTQIISLYQYHAAIANSYGLNLVAYEGGASMPTWAFSGADKTLMDKFVADLLADPRMADLYQQSIDGFVAAGGDLYNTYIDTGQGVFATLTNIYEEGNLRWDVLSTSSDSASGGLHLNAKSWGSTVEGGLGRDWLVGLGSADVLNGNAGDDTLQGNAGTDVLNGGIGNDLLDGGTGIDTMVGGAGNDTYVVDDAKDKIVETAGGGFETIRAMGSSYKLGDNLENLFYYGTGAFVGTGNALDNAVRGGAKADKLFGGDGNDMLTGGGGNDVLHGDAGADKMLGGKGDDLYYVDSASDTVTEYMGEGTDYIYSSLNSYALGANVENLKFIGTGNFSATGNGLANYMKGAAGNDVFLGLDGNDMIYGMDGNDVLSGGLGYDKLVGGLGDDVYYVDSRYDRVVEYAGQGTDTILSEVTYSMPTGVENLNLLGTRDIAGNGNALANVIQGNIADNVINGFDGDDRINGDSGDDTIAGSNGNDSVSGSFGHDVLYGNDGNDTLDGGLDADVMYGGKGNDAFYVDDAGDKVIESVNEGTDVVVASIDTTLTDNVEQLALQGTARSGTGNALANLIVDQTAYAAGAVVTLSGLGGNDTVNAGSNAAHLYGGEGRDQLSGSSQSDVLVGGAGVDTLLGYGGADTFVFGLGDTGNTRDTADLVMDFWHSQGDKIDLSGFESAAGGSLSFIGNGAFTGAAGQVQVTYTYYDYQVSIDLNGDGNVDAMLKIGTTQALVASDFVL